MLRRQWAPGQVCAGRGTCGTCVTLPPLLALSGVAEMPDNEVSGCTKRFLVPERGRAGLEASWPQPPPCNSWVAAGGSGLPGGARTCRPLHVPPWLAGCGPDARSAPLSFPCCWRVPGGLKAADRLFPGLADSVDGSCGRGAGSPIASDFSLPIQLCIPRLGHLGLLSSEGSWPHS